MRNAVFCVVIFMTVGALFMAYETVAYLSVYGGQDWLFRAVAVVAVVAVFEAMAWFCIKDIKDKAWEK